MLYSEYLKHLDHCPFCDPKNRKISESETAFLTYSKAPYHEHHLLVIPKRHIVRVRELTAREKTDVDDLVDSAIRALENLGMRNISVLVRDGQVNSTGNKSVDHLHYHVVPEVRIGDVDSKGKERAMLSDSQCFFEVEAIRQALS